MHMVSIDEVYKAQAYILIYVRASVESLALALQQSATSDSGAKLITSSIARFTETCKRSGDGGRLGVKRRKTTIWWYGDLSELFKPKITVEGGGNF